MVNDVPVVRVSQQYPRRWPKHPVPLRRRLRHNLAVGVLVGAAVAITSVIRGARSWDEALFFVFIYPVSFFLVDTFYSRFGWYRKNRYGVARGE